MASVHGTGVGRSVVIAACLVLLAACQATSPQRSPPTVGVGAVATEIRSVGPFDKVEVHHTIELRLAIGSPPRVSVSAQPNLLAMTTTIVSARRLVVEAREDFDSLDGIIATVTAPTITELALRDSAVGHVVGLDAALLVVHVDDGASLTMTGRAGWLGLFAHADSVIDLGGFVARNATVGLSQGVVARMRVSDSISGSASEGVALTVCGDPAIVDVRTSADSMVVRRCVIEEE